MASAISIAYPATARLKRQLADVAGVFLSDEEYDAMLSQFIVEGPTNTFRPYQAGASKWRATSDMAFTEQVITDGSDDHLYRCLPDGGVFGYRVIRALSTTTAPLATENQAVYLSDSAADFGVATAVAPGDLVIMAATGPYPAATAKVLVVAGSDGVDDDKSLTCTPLSDGGVFTAGQGYYIVRAPGTDTSESKTMTARRVNLIEAELALLDLAEAQITLQSDISVGVSTTTGSPRLRAINERKQMIRGVVRA